MVDTDGRQEQPGLEVSRFENEKYNIPIVVPRPYDHEGLQPVEDDNKRNKVPSDVFPTALYQPPQSPTGYEAVSQKLEDEVDHTAAVPKKRWLGNRRRILIGAACLIVIAIIVGAVAGVLVSKHRKSSTTTKDDGIVSPSEMTGTATTAAPGLAPTAISWGYPHLEVYVLNNYTEQAVYRKYRNANTTEANISKFQPNGTGLEAITGRNVDSSVTPAIAVNQRLMSSGNESVTLHMAESTNQRGYRVYHEDDQNWQDWGGYENDIKFYSSPSQVVYNHTLDIQGIFYISTGKNGQSLFYTFFDGTYQLPVEIAGAPNLYSWSTPAAVAWNGDTTRQDVFVVERDTNAVLHVSRESANSSWSAYASLGGYALTPPAAVSRAPGAIDLFVHGGDHGLWHLAYDDDDDDNSNNNNNGGGGGWSTGWAAVGGATRIRGQPHAISMGEDSVDVFVMGADDGAMLRATYNSTTRTWSPEAGFTTVVDTRLKGPPSAMTDGTGDIHVFAYSESSELIWTTLKPGASTGNVTVLAKVDNITAIS